MYSDIILINDLNKSFKDLNFSVYEIFKIEKFAIQSLSKIKETFKYAEHKNMFDILSDFLIKAEKASPSASQFLIDFLCDKNYSIGEPMPFTGNNCKKMLQSFASQEDVECIFEAMVLAGLHGKLTFKKSSIESVVVELTKGLEFNIKPAFAVKNIQLQNCKLITIDGYVENISEIHHVLESAAEKKETIVLCARGMSSDVVHTLKVNYDRKTVVCIPFIVPFDLEGANMLVDLAIATGSDVISSLKGQLISSVNLASYPFVDSVIVEQDRFFIKNSKNHAVIDRHVHFLQEKINSSQSDAAVEFLTKRIKRLGNNQVNITLPDDKFYANRLLSYDRCVRAFKAASDYGIVFVDDKAYPYSSIACAQFYLEQFKKLLNDLGCIIVDSK